MNRVPLDKMKGLKRFVLEAQSRILYREFVKRVVKIKDSSLKRDVKGQIRAGYETTGQLTDEQLKYRLSTEKANLRYLDELLMFSN